MSSNASAIFRSGVVFKLRISTVLSNSEMQLLRRQTRNHLHSGTPVINKSIIILPEIQASKYIHDTI